MIAVFAISNAGTGREVVDSMLQPLHVRHRQIVVRRLPLASHYSHNKQWQMLASRERERNLLKSAKGGTYESPYSKLARYFVWNRADRRAVCPQCAHSKQCTLKNRNRRGFPEGHEGAFQLGTLG